MTLTRRLIVTTTLASAAILFVGVVPARAFSKAAALPAAPLPAAAAVAAPPTLRLDRASGPASTQGTWQTSTFVTAAGDGFAPNEPVTLYFGAGALDTFILADATGHFAQAIFTVPSTAPPGSAPVLAVGRTSHLTAQTSFVVRSDWPQTGFDAGHSAWNPNENQLTAATVAHIGPSWTLGAQDPRPGEFVVSNGIAVWPTVEGLTARHELSGTPVWTRTDLVGLGSPVAGGGLAYLVGTTAGKTTVTALSIYSGVQRWATTLPSTAFGDLTLAEGSIYLAAQGESLSRLDAATGRLIWRVVAASAPRAPVVGGGLVYLRLADQSVQARTVSDGALRWSRSLTPTTGAVSGLTLQGSTLLVPTGAGLASLYGPSGNVHWITVTGAAGDVAATPDTVYTPGAAGVTALDLATGRRKWTSTVIGSPVIAGGLVYVSAGQFVSVLDPATGGALASPVDAGQFHTTYRPVVANGGLFVGIDDRDGFGRFNGSRLVRYGLPVQSPRSTTLDDRPPTPNVNQLTYTAGWKSGLNAADYRGGDSYTSTTGAAASFTFTGIGFRLWYSAAAHHGVASVTADRRTPNGIERTVFTVDEYSAVRRDGVTSAASPILPLGTYTVRVAATGAHRAAATGSTISLDRIDLARS